ncbi:MAG: NAD-dependent epimerase/dehydratase [Acidobacteriota bacterium]|nr:NAD-dependent epimerase/dehydratase [Acidobacteriota bacterium]MDP2388872.1 NAD-dependent epimerase/dehydratase [Acidobacteriota bacterium]
MSEPAAPAWLHDYAGKTVVVTGAGGFLGGRLVARLAGTACTIVRVSRTAPLAMPASQATICDETGDVGSRALWDRLITGADLILHLAAQTSAAAADADPEADAAANINPIRHLLAACRQQGHQPAILFAGTVTQTGVPSKLPVDEDAPDHPVTVYDRHKLMAERELKDAVSRGWARGATLRLSNVYGPGSPGSSQDRDVLNRMIKKALRGDPLTVFGAGDWLRDYLFVDDAAEAFLMAGLRSEQVSGRHYVVGSGEGVTIRQAFELVAARVEAATGRRVPVVTDDSPRQVAPIERRHFVADSGRLAADAGWRPRWALADGIDHTIKAYLCAS